MNTLTVYVMTRNRPDLIMRSINSVLSQTFKAFDLIVSDNSDNNYTKELLINNKMQECLEYVKREPPFLSLIDHLNTIHDEVLSDYYVIFHDDDEMLPEMLESQLMYFEKHENTVAVGTNALAMYGNVCRGKIISRSSIEVIETKTRMGQKFVEVDIAPFPSYMYNRHLVKDVRHNYQLGGKYSDSSFIVELLSNGNISILPQSLMKYYFHSGQVSASHDFTEYISLIRYLRTLDHVAVKSMRVRNIYFEMARRIQLGLSLGPIWLSLKLMCRYSTFCFFPKLIIRYIIKK